MRHGHGLRKLNRTSSHRLAMFRNMAVSMLRSARFSGDRRPQCTSKMSLSPSRFVRNVWSYFAG